MSSSHRLLCFAPFGGFRVHHQLDAIASLAMALRGAEIAILGCDGLFPSCDVLAYADNKCEACKNCAHDGKEYFGSFGLPYFTLNTFVTSEDREAAKTWVALYSDAQLPGARLANYPLGNWALSSIHTYFRISNLVDASPEVIAVYREFLIGAFLTVRALEKIIRQVKPTAMSVFNARYAPYRVAFELAKAHGIRVFSHERGMSDGTFVLCDGETAVATKPLFDTAKVWQNVPLTSDQFARAKEHLLGRERGHDMNYPSFYSFSSEFTEVRQQLRIPPDAKIFGVFTSSEFELAFSEEFRSLTCQIETIDQLIEIFRHRAQSPGCNEYLVIRHHPYSGGKDKSPPDFGFLTKAYRQAADLPPNVRIIMPHERLSSYALMRHVDAAICFFSTIGMELAARGIPTAASQASPYSLSTSHTLHGFDRIELEKLVNKLLSVSSAERHAEVKRAFRFVYTFIARHSQTFRSFTIHDHFQPKTNVAHINELLPGNDETLDRLCNFMMEGSSIFPTPTVELGENCAERIETAKVEDQLIDAWLATFDNETRLVREQSLEKDPLEQTMVAVISASQSSHSAEANSWALSSRHRALRFVPWDTSTSVPLDHQLVALRNLLRTLNEEFVYFSFPDTFVDQALLQAGLKLLNSTPAAAAVIFGAWLQDGSGRLVGELLTERDRADNPDPFARLKAELPNQLSTLGLFLFRRSQLGNAIDRVCSEKLADSFVVKLLDTLAQCELKHEPYAMLTILKPDGQNSL